MHVEITGPGVNRREYKGRFYVEQPAALHLGGAYPLVFRVNRPEDDQLAKGNYNFGDGSFYTDEHGNLKFKRPNLAPLSSAK